MMADMRPRIEELSSSDDGDSDPEEMDITNFAPVPTTFTPAKPPGQPKPSTVASTSSAVNNTLLDPSNFPGAVAPRPPKYDKEKVRNWQCLYPLYFDASRTRSEGRRVGKELAVPNPLAREIVEAVGKLGLQVAFEPGKCHPRDWANPGRVRVLLAEEGSVVNNSGGITGSKLFPICLRRGFPQASRCFWIAIC